MTSRKVFAQTFMARHERSAPSDDPLAGSGHHSGYLGGQTLRVLDAGGGEGQTAIKMAERGHHVTLATLSAEMVARATRAAEEKGVSDNMHFIQCAAQDIAQHLETPVDLILFPCGAGVGADPQSVLQTLWSMLRRAARCRVFYNANGFLMHNMVAGNFDYVQVGMPKKKKAHAFPAIRAIHSRLWLAGSDWLADRRGRRASGCVHDYLREKHKQRDCFDTLTELETRYCRQEPFISLGRYIPRHRAQAADARITYE